MAAPTTNRIVLAGGSGFIGKALHQSLSSAGYEVWVLTRKPDSTPQTSRWDGESVGDWGELLEGAAAVINLAGAPVTMRWTDDNKKEILESRVQSTEAIGKAIRKCQTPPPVWINSSAVGYYGDRGDEELNESSGAGEGFLAETCLAWERAQEQFETPQTRQVRVRTGVALGRGGGAYEELSKFTKRFMGGSQGSGKQWMPWIHLTDLCRAFSWALTSDYSGPLNGVGPSPMQNADVMAAFREAFHRPWSPPAPGFAMEMVGALMGVQTEVVLMSQRALPKVLQDHGFEFEFHDLATALRDLAQSE